MSSEAPEQITIFPEGESDPDAWVRYRRIDLVERELAERDAEIANLKGEVEHWKRLYDDSLFDIAEVRQRARLPEELVELLEEIVECNGDSEAACKKNGVYMHNLIVDVLAAVEQKESGRE